MSVITIINTLLNSKLVQWGMLIVLVIGFIFSIIFGFKFYTLKLSNAILAKENAAYSSAISVQNNAIKRMATQSKDADAKLKEAVKKASQIAVETQTILKPIVEYKYIGTCDEKLSQALELIQGVK